MENSGDVFFGDDSPVWHLAVGDSHIGPFTASDIYQKILAQEISWAHYIWRPGQAEWLRVCDVPTFQPAVPRSPKALPKPAVAGGKGAGASSSNPTGGGKRAKADTGQSTGSSSHKRSPERSDDTRNLTMRPPGPEDRVWFLYYNQTQYGPFSQDEVNRLVLVGRVHGRVHAWKNGLPNWERLERLPDFRAVVKRAAELPELHRTRTIELNGSDGESQGKESATGADGRTRGSVVEEPSVGLIRDKRSTLRAPLIAKILMADEKGVTVGLCRDISIGGMQVLTDRIPGDVGARIRLNVSALGDDATSEPPHKIEPFVAEGVVVRILEDKRGFSFRFDKLSAPAKRAIEQYIDATQ